MSPVFNTSASADELKRALLPQEERIEVRRADLRGDKNRQYSRMKRWIEDDPYESFLQRAEERAELLRKEQKARVTEGFNKALGQGLSEAYEFLNRTRQDLMALHDEAARRSKEQKQGANDLTKDLNDEVSALESSLFPGIRLRRRAARLIEMINARNIKSWSAARNRKLADLTEELLVVVSDLSASLTELERKLIAVREILQRRLQQTQKDLDCSGVFEEFIGSVEDVRDELPDAVDLTRRLPAWLELGLSEQEILDDLLGELGRRVADGALDRSFIDLLSRPDLEKHIASAYRLAAPYLRLKRRSPGSCHQAFILRGYDGDRDVAAGVPEEVAQPWSPSFSHNEVLVLRVRMGIHMEDLADRAEWKRWGEKFRRLIPLHTLPFLTIKPDPPKGQAVSSPREE